jgi:hypothetical protein
LGNVTILDSSMVLETSDNSAIYIRPLVKLQAAFVRKATSSAQNPTRL